MAVKKRYLLAVLLVMGLGVAAPASADLADDMNKQTQAFAGKQGADFGTPRDPREIAATIINSLLGLLGTLLVCYVVYGGYLVLLSGGDEDKISEGKKVIKNAVIGLALILSAYGISKFVINKLAIGNNEYIEDYCDVYEQTMKAGNNKDPYEQAVPNAVLQQKCAEQKAAQKE